MRGVRVILMVGAALAPAAAGLAVESRGELGKVTRRHEPSIIGREERDNTFRKPGSILGRAAATDRSPVDLDLLSARQRAMCQGQSFTRGLPALAGRDPAPVEVAAPPTRAAAATGGLTAAHYAGIVAGLGVLLGFAGWFVRRPRRESASATPASSRRRRRRAAWADRDLKITMGHRDE